MGLPGPLGDQEDPGGHQKSSASTPSAPPPRTLHHTWIWRARDSWGSQDAARKVEDDEQKRRRVQRSPKEQEMVAEHISDQRWLSSGLRRFGGAALLANGCEATAGHGGAGPAESEGGFWVGGGRRL